MTDASPRLRDESKRLRGSTLTNITLALTDPVLETATVVRRVLRVLTGAKLNLTHDLVSERRVLLLLRKWGCHPILQNLLLRIRHALVREPTKFSPLHVWATGAVLGDVETCVAALEVPTTWPSSSEEGHRADAGTVGVSVFNPLSWPLEWWEMGIPPKYVWALCQAYLKSANGEGRIDIPTLVETFKGTLEESGADASLS